MKKVVLLLIIHLTLSIPSTTKANGFSVDIFHRYSPLSPFYNASMNSSEVLLNAALRSISRDYSLLNFTIGGNKAESVLLQDEGAYLAKIFIGTPPFESIVSIDTGSSLIWIQCLPCSKCYPQKDPIFNPRKSSTYKIIPCDSPSCSVLASSAHCTKNECRYKYKYMDGSVTIGDVASDVISFGSNGNIGSTKSTFGCGHYNNGIFARHETGVMGLGNAPLSLVFQQGDKIGRIFSYCFVPMTSTATGKLIFGSKSTQSGTGLVSTHFNSKPQSPLYYLTLQAITVDNVKVSSPAVGGSKIFIDSGTTLTKLEQEFYKYVETAVGNSIPYEAMDFPPHPFKLCYDENDVTIDDAPDTTFHFAGADLQLSVENMFGMVRDHVLCMLIVPSSDFSVFGSLAQVNIKVEYDLVQSMISVKPTVCAEE